MSGGACTVIISSRQAFASAETMADFASQGLLTDVQKNQAILANEEYINKLTSIADAIDEDTDDDD